MAASLQTKKTWFSWFNADGFDAEDYEAWRRHFVRVRVDAVAVLIILANLAFIALDHIAYPRHADQLFVIRSIMFAAAISTLAIRPLGRKFPFITCFFLHWITATSLTQMTLMLGGFHSYYIAGYMMLQFAVASLIPVRLWLHLTCNGVGIATYFAINIVFASGSLPVTMMILWAFFLLFTTIVAVTSVFLYEQLKRREFESGRKLKQAHHELLELDRIKGEFFANISHEFRTPLTLILGPIEELISEQKKAQGSQESIRLAGMLEIIDRNARRLLRLINQLLDISKIEASGMQLRKVDCDVRPLLGHLISSFDSAAKKKGLTLLFERPNHEVVVNIDEVQMEKVFLNLLSNALKFTERGTIKAGVKVDGKDARITFCDTGRGIPNSERKHIFNRFRQVDASRSREQEGTGIGLALVKEVVELHGGKIEVESSLNEGSQFMLTLPLSSGSVRPMEQPEQMLASQATRLELASLSMSKKVEQTECGKQQISMETVLIIEDNDDMRSFLRSCLEETYHLIEAKSGLDGLEKAKKNIPSVILSDIMMPGMDGYQVVEKLRSEPETEKIPVILLTAKSSDSQRLEGLEAGADDYLHKPFNSKELSARIRNLIRSKQYERRLESEMITARAVQETLLSKRNDIPGISIASYYQSADITGGDWFRYHYDAHQHRVLGFIADVTGHGIPSALITALICGAVEGLLSELISDRIGNPYPSRALLQRLATCANKTIRNTAVESSHYMTMSIFCLEVRRGALHFLNAAHVPAFVIKNGVPKMIVQRSPILGAQENAVFHATTCHLKPGDYLVLYSDGVVDCRSEGRSRFGFKNLQEVLSRKQFLSAQELVDTIVTERVKYWGTTQPKDDMTILAMQFLGSGKEQRKCS